MAKKRTFPCGANAGNPERACSHRVANQNAGFASSYPLADSAIAATNWTGRSSLVFLVKSLATAFKFIAFI